MRRSTRQLQLECDAVAGEPALRKVPLRRPLRGSSTEPMHHWGALQQLTGCCCRFHRASKLAQPGCCCRRGCPGRSHKPRTAVPSAVAGSRTMVS